ncbi:MAG: hypothetical protein JNL83_20165 [Myxococcales bacterium]|nr:hypothetical protein [Myxococcales bacterium]
MIVRPGGAFVVLIALATSASAEPAGGEGQPAPTASTAPAPTGTVAKAQPASDPATSSEAAPPKRFDWEPFGYLRMQYIAVQDDPLSVFVGRNDGFELQNARFGIRGTLLDRAAFVVAIEGAVDARRQVNTPRGRMEVRLKDAFVDTHVSSQIDVRAGFFESLVDPNIEGDTVREFVDRPLESRGMRATEGFETSGLTPGRSLGAAIRLQPVAPASGAAVGFEVAVQNGADEYASNNDNNLPAASASALLLLPAGGWMVASARFNRRTVGDVQALKNEDDLQGTIGARIIAGPVAFGAAAAFVRTTYPTTGGPVQNAYGAHGQLTYTIPARTPVTLGYRFGILDPSSLLLTDRVMEHTVGAAISVPAYSMRLQLQATHVVEQRELSNGRVQLAAEVAL